MGNLDFIKIGPGDVIHVASGGAIKSTRTSDEACQDVEVCLEKSADDYGVVIRRKL